MDATFREAFYRKQKKSERSGKKKLEFGFEMCPDRPNQISRRVNRGPPEAKHPNRAKICWPRERE